MGEPEEEQTHAMNVSLPERLQSPDTRDFDALDFEEHPLIVNMQKCMYELLISDQGRKIERLQNRNEELYDLFDSVKNASSSKNLESENEIVELNVNIAFQVKKIDELKRKHKDFKKMSDEIRQAHLDRVKDAEDKFAKTKIKYFSKIKSINSRINAIDDFKLVCDTLKKTYDARNAQIQQNEEGLEQKLKDIDFKSKIHKENLKKETTKQVLEASVTFQSEMKTTVPVQVQRLMRENIVLQNELALIWNDRANLQEKKIDYTTQIQTSRDKIKDAKLGMKRRMITLKVQSLILKKLKSAYSTVQGILSKSFNAPENFEKKYLLILEHIKNPRYFKYFFRTRKLEILLHQERIKLEAAKKFKRKTCYTLKTCSDALSLIQHASNAALLLNKHKPKQDFKSMDVENFAYYLLDVIEDCESKMWNFDTKSVQTIPDSSNAYAIGDLGFEPPHIEVEGPVRQEIKKVPPVRSTLAVLKELEELSKTESADERRSLKSQKSHGSGSTEASSSSESEKSGLRGIDTLMKEHGILDYFEGMWGEYGEEEWEEDYGDYDDYMNYDEE